MPKKIEIRNVPDDLYEKLTARAGLAGKSLSDYVLDEMRRSAGRRPTLSELNERLNKK